MWCSKVNKIVENNFINGQRYVELQSSDLLFYIRGGRSGKFRIDTANKTFLCLQFEQMQYPCIHTAAAIISFSKQNIHDFVPSLYKSEKLFQLNAMLVGPILVSELDFKMFVHQFHANYLGDKKIDSEIEVKVRKAISLFSMCYQNGHNK